VFYQSTAYREQIARLGPPVNKRCGVGVGFGID
jgi:hypothetical protein